MVTALTGPQVTVLPAAGTTRAVALLLHGGQQDSLAPTSRAQLAALRMRPFTRGLPGDHHR